MATSHVLGSVRLYWLPLGAGTSVVRSSGRLFEAVQARLRGRTPMDLYHSALEVDAAEGRFVIEMAPAGDGIGLSRGVVAHGSVGLRHAGRLRIFRYEVRRWRDGAIPDVDAAVGSPLILSADPLVGSRVLDLVPSVPTPVWGRDDLRTGEMWTSNSVISWVLASSDVPVDRIRLPPHGRAPGWDAGRVIGTRHRTKFESRPVWRTGSRPGLEDHDGGRC